MRVKKPRTTGIRRAKPLRYYEEKVQIGIFNYLSTVMCLHKFKTFLAFHVPNGGFRSPTEGAILKAMGVMSGVADIILLIPFEGKITGDKFPRTIFIELKFKQVLPPKPVRLRLDGQPYKARAVSETAGQESNQKFFQAVVQEMGFEYHLLQCVSEADGLRQVVAILKQNGVNV